MSGFPLYSPIRTSRRAALRSLSRSPARWRRRVAIRWPALLVGMILAAPPASDARAQTSGGELPAGPVDRILASVDETPILESDIDQLLLIGVVRPAAGESPELFRRRVLDLVIEQTLRFHEVDKFGFTELPAIEIDQGVGAIRARYGSDAAYLRALTEVGLDEAGLRELIARQVMVLTYVDERLGARVFVSLDDIQEYYSETLVPDLKERGLDVPPISEVREQVREVLRESRLNEEIERWTLELRAEADVVNHLDSERGAPPPVAATLAGERRREDG